MRGGRRAALLPAVLTAWVALAMLGTAAASAASIAGTVTDEDTDAGIAGIEVCAGPSPGADAACAKTSAGGTYLLDGLIAGSYQVHFSAIALPPNYVQEWYGGDQIYPGDLVTIAGAEAKTGIDAELEAGGVVTGTATDAETSGPAAGVWVCVEAVLPVFFGLCQQANSQGKYETSDLPSGEFVISFDGENAANYLRRFYDEAGSYGTATKVPVTVGSTVSGIDAELDPGGEILGTVTEAGTGSPLAGVEVCVLEDREWMGMEEFHGCTKTDAGGHYAIRSLREAAYRVVFSREGSFWVFDTFDEQWWNGQPSAEGSAVIDIFPPQTVTGVDAQLVDSAPAPETGGGGGGDGAAVMPPPSLPSAMPPAKRKLPKCKKGFHRKLVKGKKRCVDKHRRSRR